MTAPAEKIKKHLASLKDFTFKKRPRHFYCHIGATLTDSILQAGLDYTSVVLPRVERLVMSFPESKTVSGFLRLLESKGPRLILNWTPSRKTNCLHDLLRLLLDEQVEIESDLALWLAYSTSKSKLHALNGIGPKTIDYLAMLLGEDNVPIDRHIRRLAYDAGVKINDYYSLQETIYHTCILLKCPPSTFDYSVWTYFSELAKTTHETEFFGLSQRDSHAFASIHNQSLPKLQ